MSNQFESKARARKVRRIVRVIRLASAGRQNNAGLRRSAEMMTQGQRDQVARVARVNSPSDTTWARVVMALGRSY